MTGSQGGQGRDARKGKSVSVGQVRQVRKEPILRFSVTFWLPIFFCLENAIIIMVSIALPLGSLATLFFPFSLFLSLFLSFLRSFLLL